MVRVFIFFAVVFAAVAGSAALTAPALKDTFPSTLTCPGVVPGTSARVNILVRNFYVTLLINSTLRDAVNNSIVISDKHGASSHDPWSLDDFLCHFNTFLTYIPTPEVPMQFIFTAGNLFSAPIWMEDAKCVAFLEQALFLRGTFLYSSTTAEIVSAWMNDPDINISQYVVPVGGFQSWGDFFTRDVKDSARPVYEPSNASVVVSPVDAQVDGVFLSSNTSRDAPLFKIKGKGGMPINAFRVLGRKTYADVFQDGPSVLLFLSAYNFHRWRSPVTGTVADVYRLGGMYFQTPAEGWYPYFVYDYHRVVIIFDVDNDGDHVEASSGAAKRRVAMVAVGITEVGSVIPTVAPGQHVVKGQPIGQFDLGGSAVFMFFTKDSVPDPATQLIPKVEDNVTTSSGLLRLKKLP